VLELPARSTRVQKFRGKFAQIEQAEQVVAEQWGDRALLVESEDLTEEIERRQHLIES
jgi:hypothetical protein